MEGLITVRSFRPSVCIANSIDIHRPLGFPVQIPYHYTIRGQPESIKLLQAELIPRGLHKIFIRYDIAEEHPSLRVIRGYIPIAITKEEVHMNNSFIQRGVLGDRDFT
jgi:hypothetical protein